MSQSMNRVRLYGDRRNASILSAQPDGTPNGQWLLFVVQCSVLGISRRQFTAPDMADTNSLVIACCTPSAKSCVWCVSGANLRSDTAFNVHSIHDIALWQTRITPKLGALSHSTFTIGSSHGQTAELFAVGVTQSNSLPQ